MRTIYLYNIKGRKILTSKNSYVYFSIDFAMRFY